MPQIESYGIDGPDQHSSSYETIAGIPYNRVLFTGKFTQPVPSAPLIAHGLTGLSQVFDFYSPEIVIRFQSREGKVFKEQFRFSGLGDFSSENIQQQSSYIRQLKNKKVQHQKMLRQLKTNKELRALMADGEAKQKLVDILKAMLKESKSQK